MHYFAAEAGDDHISTKTATRISGAHVDAQGGLVHLLEEPVIELVVCLLATQLLQGEKMEPHEREVPAGDHLESGIVSYEFLEGSCHADMGADVVLGASKQPNIYGYMLSRFQLL